MIVSSPCQRRQRRWWGIQKRFAEQSRMLFQLSPPVQQDESSPDSEITSEVSDEQTETGRRWSSCSSLRQMDDQLNDDTTCGSVDSNTRGITITPRVNFVLSRERSDRLSPSYRWLSRVILSVQRISRRRYPKTIWIVAVDIHHHVQRTFSVPKQRSVYPWPTMKCVLFYVIDKRKITITWVRENERRLTEIWSIVLVERRRRFNINDRIKELGTLLPKGTEL